MVAVKVDQQDQCPADVTKQPYTKTNAPGPYKMELSNDPEPNWSITYEKRCIDDTWRMFSRPVGPICIKVIGNEGKNFLNSTIDCQNLGTGIEVGGFQTKQEFDYVLGIRELSLPRQLRYVFFSTWIPKPYEIQRHNFLLRQSVVSNGSTVIRSVYSCEGGNITCVVGVVCAGPAT
uniref:CUB domain-containing protein n=1 Tax=Caenorhabditis tropicalis TaxID=1561998 RepID=A0A1I7U6J8_9PELO